MGRHGKNNSFRPSLENMDKQPKNRKHGSRMGAGGIVVRCGYCFPTVSKGGRNLYLSIIYCGWRSKTYSLVECHSFTLVFVPLSGAYHGPSGVISDVQRKRGSCDMQVVQTQGQRSHQAWMWTRSQAYMKSSETRDHPHVGARSRYHLSFWRFFPCFIALFGPIWGQSM